MGGGDFLKNPKGLNLLFCKPGTYLCSLFFILFFCFRSRIFLEKSVLFVSETVRLARVSNFGVGQKTKVNYKRFCPEPKFETLAALFDFLWCLKGKYTVAVSVNSILLLKNAKHLKKTM